MARRWTASTSPTSAVSSSHQGWLRTVDLLNWLVDHWDQPEEGTWETRGGRKNFTYGRLMSGVAMDRGIRLATTHGRPTPLERWQRERNAIYNQIMSRGWSPQRNAFVQEYDNTVLDASLLRMPTVGFISGVFGDAVLALGALVWRTSTVQSALARESNQAAAERCRRWPHSTGLR